MCDRSLLSSCLPLQPVNRQSSSTKQAYVLGIQLRHDYTARNETHGHGLQFLADLLKQEAVRQHLSCHDDRIGIRYANQVHYQAGHSLGYIAHNLCTERVPLATETIDLADADPFALLWNQELGVVVAFQKANLGGLTGRLCRRLGHLHCP